VSPSIGYAKCADERAQANPGKGLLEIDWIALIRSCGERPSIRRCDTVESSDNLTALTRQEVIARIVDFVRSIGLEVSVEDIPHETFMPGLTVHHGTLVVDLLRLRAPGDLLHEAGHLAVMEPGRRRRCHVDVGKRAAEEMMAIAWSYAAVVHLHLDPAIVFHDEGYRGGSQALIDNFTHGRFIAVPTLQWIGMTADAVRAQDLGVPPYPHMLKWLNDIG
jgi:hypothetical protein